MNLMKLIISCVEPPGGYFLKLWHIKLDDDLESMVFFDYKMWTKSFMFSVGHFWRSVHNRKQKNWCGFHEKCFGFI